MPKIYLAHKFEKQKEALVIQSALEAQGWQVLNPFARGEQVKYDKMLKEGDGYLDDATCREIVATDLDTIDEADAVFAILSPNAIGTVMEIFYTAQEGKPVLTLLAYKMPYRHPWIATCSTEVFDEGEGDTALKAAKNLLARLSINADPVDPIGYFQQGDGHAGHA